MKVTLHQLKVFAVVAETGSVTRAAQKLHMTQPAVSIQIKQLEQYYGLALIEIIGKKLYLTEAGHELHHAYTDIAARLTGIDMTLAQLRGSLKGCLSISVVSTAKYFIPHFLGEFIQQYPQIEIRLNVTNRQSVIARINDNQDDLVILSQLPDKLPIHAQAMLEDHLVISAAPNHPLAKKKKIKLAELKNERFIWREPGSGTRMVMEKLFAKYKLKPKISMELGSSEAIKQAVIANIGLSLLSKISLEPELRLKRLVILNIEHLPLRHFWYAVYHKNKILSPVAKTFLKFLAEHAKKF